MDKRIYKTEMKFWAVLGSRGCSTDKRTDVWSQDFLIWEINFGLLAVAWAGLWEKMVWADYEQLLRPVFHFFGVKKIL